MAPAQLVSVNIVHGIVPDPRGDVGRTAIDKRPVDGPVEVQLLGPVGDTVLDRKHHGGRDQAVYAYALEDYAFWAAELGRDLAPGTFGENLTTEGLDLTGAVIGERWLIKGAAGAEGAAGAGRGGSVLLEVTSPRVPCTTFQGWMDEPHWVKRFTDHGAPGAYLRVLEEGTIAAGSTVDVVHRPDHGVTIGEVFQLRFADPTRLQLLLDVQDDLQPALVDALRSQVARA